MIYFDRSLAKEKAMQKQAFDDLKEKLSKSKKKKDIDTFFYISHIEDRINNLEEKLKNYQDFFTKLKELMPKDSIRHGNGFVGNL